MTGDAVQLAADVIAVLTAAENLDYDTFELIVAEMTDEEPYAIIGLLNAVCQFTWGMAEGANIDLKESLVQAGPNIYKNDQLQ